MTKVKQPAVNADDTLKNDPLPDSSTPSGPAVAPMDPARVPFSAEQAAIVNQMITEALKNQANSASPNQAISMYNVRDPKKIETVNVRRFLGKFVMGFKDLQTDPFKKIPKYYKAGVDPIRKLTNEPYVVLLLSDDGETVEEKEVLLVDYMNERETYIAQVLEIKLEEKIHDHGILGSRQDSMGMAIEADGKPSVRQTIKAQSKTVEREFVVQLPGFKKPSVFKSDFLA